MSFFKALGEKPWLAQVGEIPVINNDVQNIMKGKTALKFFLAVVGVIFFLFTVTFLSRTQFPDFMALAGEPWQPFTNPVQLWYNTAALLMGGIALQWAKLSAKENHLNRALAGIIIGIFFSLSFLIGQLLVWNQLYDLGYVLTSNPANSYFYLFTAVHGVHILGGLFALFKVTFQFIRKNSLTKLSLGIGLCTTYWHFLFVVWLLLFALLTSSPETYKTIAQLCGF
ncbi:MAG: cytochrome c oxidase subunit 3 [Alphaproteobacteria bacterium]|jgi:cytochrome c oxidase subunit 3